MADVVPVAPWSAVLSLDDTLRRLRRSRRIAAVGFLGSTGTAESGAASDYDLLLLAADPPAGYGIEATIIDHRIADIVVVGADEAETEWDAVAMTDREWAIAQWLARVRPVHDPDQALRRARDRAVEVCRRRPPVSDRWQHTTRAFISHDLRVNEALLRRSDDPVARMALGMRQLHTFVAVVQAWFTARGLRAEGWKANIRRIADTDTRFLAIIERWLAAADSHTRHSIFQEAVHHALAPLGGPLPTGTTAPDPDFLWDSLAPPPAQ